VGFNESLDGGKLVPRRTQWGRESGNTTREDGSGDDDDGKLGTVDDG
jgi:hypothetical protein